MKTKMLTTKNFILISKPCEQYDHLMTAIYCVFWMLSVTQCVCVCVCVCARARARVRACVPYLHCSKIPENVMDQKVLFLQPKLKSYFLFVDGMKSGTPNWTQCGLNCHLIPKIVCIN
jgi:hypothetical protein